MIQTKHQQTNQRVLTSKQLDLVLYLTKNKEDKEIDKLGLSCAKLRPAFTSFLLVLDS